MTGRTLAHYEILQKLGQGGMGVVWKARDTHLDRFVALKLLPPERVADPECKRRFIQEAKAASALNHPNIITVYDVGQAQGLSYIAMEYVPGKTLRQVIGRQGMPAGEAIKHALQIAEALSKAHAAGIVHRDLKPGNVMVREDGLVKVLDFGLAKLWGQKLRGQATPSTEGQGSLSGELPTRTLGPQTQEGVIIGTVAYMSPEQAQGKPVEARSDVFSFGSVLFEMVTGRRAFPGDTAASTLAAVLKEEPQFVAEAAGQIPAELEAVIRCCLRKDPSERYRDAAELKQVLEELARPRPEGAVGVPSVAVLPFVNLNRDEENEFFADGLTEELINALAQLEGLRVVSRTSAFRFKGATGDIREIGYKLRVGAALEGTVRRAGGRLRVTAQLVNVADGYQLWSERFDRDMEGVFELQDELTRAIVATLQVKLGREERNRLGRRSTANPEAHELCLKGRYHFYQFTRESFREAIEYFEKARRVDPRCALASAWLANAYCCLAILGLERPREVVPRAAAAVKQALEIDPAEGRAHTALGGIRHWYEWDWAGAESAYRRALELNPSAPLAYVPYAELLVHQSRVEEALKVARRAVELDPVSPEANRMLALVLFYGRRYQEAIQQCRVALEIEERYYPFFLLALIHGMQGQYPEARAAAQQACRLAPAEPLCQAARGWALARAGETAEAARIVNELTGRRLRGYSSATLIAWVYLGLDQREQTFEWLETAMEERDPVVVGAGASPLVDPVRADPRFQRLLRTIGLGH